MSDIYFPRTVSRERSQLLPWRFFLFINLLLFLALHWPLQIHASIDDYNEAQTVGVEGGEGAIVRQVALIVLCVVAIVGWRLGRDSKTPRLRIQGFMGWLPMAFVAWASMSTIWSNDVPLTLKRLVSFLILCMVAVAVAKTFTLRKIILWVFFTTAVGLVIAIFAELATGIFHPLAYGYRFSGIQHPNGEGAECGILVLSGLVAGSTETEHRRLYRGFALLGFIFLVLSVSRTAVIATLLAAAVYAITISSGKTKIMLAPVFVTLVSFLIFLFGTGLSSGLGRAITMGRVDVADSPDSISGRTVIWKDVGPYISQHPITGYGYQSFWTPARLTVIQDEEQWNVPDSHSTYVDCLLTLGIVGLMLFALSLLSGLWQAFESYRVTRNPYFAFLGGILIFCIISGFFESALGEGGVLTLLSLIVLARLAFVPPATAVRSPADTFSAPKEICLV
jgi:exopolysaccharide production protein ExoQ